MGKKINKVFTDNFALFGYFKCQYERRYLTEHRICNGIVDCLYGSDEMFCQLSKISINKCRQINFMKLECNNNISTPIEVQTKFIQENDPTIKYYEILGNIHMSFITNSIYVNIMKIIENFKFLNTLNSVFFPNLYCLIIINSNLTKDTIFFQQKLRNLQYLDISKNPIDSLEILQKQKIQDLQFLNVSFTRIKYLEEIYTAYLQNLQTFVLTNCFFLKIDENFFQNFSHLKILQMKNTIVNFDIEFLNFHNLKEIKKVQSNYFKICCLFWKYTKYLKNFQCSPQYSTFRTCSNLINGNSKQIIFFVVGFLGSLGNLCVLCFVIKQFQLSQFFQILLSYTEFFISFHILAIAVANIYFDKNFMKSEIKWRKSYECQILGTKTTFSILLTSVSANLMSIERYLIVVNPMKSNIISKNIKKIILSIITLTFCFSLIPFVFEIVKIILFKIKFFLCILFY